MFSFSHSVLDSLAEVSVRAEKIGYYSARRERMLGPKYNLRDWDFTETLVLNKVGKPIAMYAKWINENPPTLGQPIGFDLTVGDWVCGGKGVNP